MKPKLKIFRIYYKAYLGEQSDWCYDDLLAATEEEALRRFLRRKKITDGDSANPDSWRWWEGDWWCGFKIIDEVRLDECPIDLKELGEPNI